ncbi:MAG: SdpI family protein [Steroidobacteraceae bacterium]
MKPSERWPLALGLGVCLTMLALSTWAWLVTPADFQFSVHFDLSGRADRLGGKAEGLLLLPAIALLLLVLFPLLPRLDPRRENLERSSRLYGVIWIGVLVILGFAHATVVLVSLQVGIDPLAWMPLLIGAFLMILGNNLGKSRSNFFAGIRTPWTLSSEYAWMRTHRLGGKLFMLAGLATCLAFFLFGWDTEPGRKKVAWVLMAGIGVASLVSVVASYIFWRSDPERPT